MGYLGVCNTPLLTTPKSTNYLGVLYYPPRHVMILSPATQVIKDSSRLQALQDLDLLDTPFEEAFDRLTRLASKITRSPVSLVSLVDADRQFFKSLFGLPEPWASKRETPLSHSFCQHVVATNEPLIVADARQHEWLKDNLAIPNLNIIAYLGMPLNTSDGVSLGSFCVIDSQPREWTAEEIDIIRELAISTMSEIELRAQVAARKQAEGFLETRNRQYQRVHRFAQSTLSHMKDAVKKGADAQETLVYISQMERELARL